MTVMTRSAVKYWWGVELPKGVISLSRSHPWEKWQEYTTAHVLAAKLREQKAQLHRKRSSTNEVEKPCLVWVFYNDTVYMSGWWVYIRTLKEDYGLSFYQGRGNYQNNDPRLLQKVMQTFHCGILPMRENLYLWAATFEKKYHFPSKKRKLNACLKARCTIREGKLIDIKPLQNG